MPFTNHSQNGATAAEHSPIELRSEEVQELLGQTPQWMIRWGISVTLGIVAILLLASWLVKYPDTLFSRVILTTKSPPVSLVTRSEGRIQFLVKDNQFTKKGTYLAVIDNPANAPDVWYLTERIQAFKAHSLKDKHVQITEFAFQENLILGELQGAYLTLLNSLRDYHREHELALYEKQIQATEQRIVQYKQLHQQLEKQEQLLAEELQLAQKQYDMDVRLLREKVIADIDFYRTKNAFLQSKRTFESARSDIIQNQILISQWQAQATEYRINQMANEEKLRNAVQTAFKQLESQRDAWEQKYVLKAPIDGEVAFSKYWSSNQFVTLGEKVIMIVPRSEDLYAQGQMPIAGSGKIEIGQAVNLKFDNYPSHEYGMVRGIVQSVSLVPRDNLYTIEIALPKGLITSYRKALPFRQEMQGTAEIITRDLRLIERIFYQLRVLKDNAQP